ncbi:MAG: hypothetical protein ACRC7O_11450 [Fimbriiglobus sp.]
MNDPVRKLLKATLTKTESGELPWVRFDDNSFHVRIGPGQLHLRRFDVTLPSDEYSEGSETRFTIELTDAQVRTFEEDEVSLSSADYRLVDDLFRAARTSAVGGKKVLDEMLTALN